MTGLLSMMWRPTAALSACAAALLLSACSDQPAGGAREEASADAATALASSGPGPAPAAQASVAPAAGKTPAPASAAPPTEPPAAFLACRACHAAEPGKHSVGPSLHGVVGRKAASLAGFNYSPALVESGIVWNRATLDQYLAAPMKMVPGTRMALGVPNAAQRTVVIDYLETLD